MAWSSPFTAVSGNVFTAAQWNTNARDNLNVSEASAAVTAGGLICTTGANALTQRTPAVQMVSTYESTASTSYTDLPLGAGPAITVNNGTVMLVSVGCLTRAATAGLGTAMSFAMSGSNTVAAADANCFYIESGLVDDIFCGTWTTMTTGLSSGTTTLTAKYRAVGATTATFAHRLIMAVPF